MPSPFDDKNGEFMVLVNEEGQHSLWPAFRQPPEGWSAVGPRGARQLCIDWIELHWTDIRPASIQRVEVG